ncbi:MAG: 50S ribosomal protein L10 [Bacteroidetes bacterium]|nr:50S ribosomal protein L10 [Bacteroidota bacterium]
MRKEDKTKVIDELVEQIAGANNFYLTDISTLTAQKTSLLRRKCFEKKISLHVVKNTLLKKAMEKTTARDLSSLIPVLKGATSIMICESGSEPARLIKEFRKDKETKPAVKAAYIEETVYVGDNQLEFLANIKSKNELIGDIIGLLQSPPKNVISALQSGKNKLAGIVKTLSDKKE